jgi:eukaryotic-like serine/threonine-protein kinase
MVGRQVNQYKVLEKIGEGGMGVVYKAEDTTLRRTVALKFVAPYRVTDEDRKARLLREARAAATLDHPNICTIYEVGEAEGRPFLAMAFVDGPTLAAKIRNNPLAVPEFLELAIQIGEGLKEAHEKGVVHHDIKSSNIMVSAKGQAKLMDFGIAEPERPASGIQRIEPSGTAAYMSPERARGNKGDKRSDIWSFGIVLYEMITGRLPFRAEYEAAVLYAVANEEPEAVEALNPDMPPELSRVIHKALQKEPAERYASVADLVSDLRALRTRLEHPTLERMLSPLGKRGSGGESSRRVWLGFAVFLALGSAVAWWQLARTASSPGAGGASPRPSIAVLPLQDLSPQPDQEFFADGMTEELITNLAKIRGLRVIARTSVMQYKGASTSLPEIAAALHVGYVLEGSVARDGERVRISAKLIDPATQQNLWAESYDRSFEGILDLQREVARAIAAEVRVQLTPVELVRLSASRTINTRAYENYLRGRYLGNRRTKEALEQALEYYQAVVANDPSSGLGYSGLADVFTLQAVQGMAPPAEVWPKAKTAAMRALELDDSLAEAHSAMGLIHSFNEWNWDQAEKEFHTAIELNPGDATAHQRYAAMLSRLGRHREAIAEMEQAHELDPLSITINNAVAVCYYMARRYDDAIRQLESNRALSPTYYRTYWNLGRCYLQKKQYPEALENLQKARELSDNNSFMIAAQANGYARAGQNQQAWQLLSDLIETSKKEYVSSMSIALVQIGLGENQSALTWLEKALGEQAGLLVWLKVDPEFDPLRAEPRFQQLLEKVGLGKPADGEP